MTYVNNNLVMHFVSLKIVKCWTETSWRIKAVVTCNHVYTEGQPYEW